jgi:hypothetical protein
MHTVTQPESLTAEQKDLVGAASADSGQLSVKVSSKTRGRAVCANRKSFFDSDDPSVALRYIEAVHSLVELRLVRESGRRSNYELTNFGWQLSNKIS